MKQRTQPMLRAPLLATTLGLLACDTPHTPLAPQRPNFAVDGNTDRITGGGKLGDGRDFATFGFNAREGQGQIQWVQHCLDGVSDDPSSKCLLGSFTFHGSTVTGYGVTPDDPRCRAWSGEGEAKLKDLATTAPFTFSAKACDVGQPGRGQDRMCFTFGAYLREDVLAGGNIQLHEGAPVANSELEECTIEPPPT